MGTTSEDAQDGVVTWQQLHAAGWGYHQIRAQVDARRWQALGPIVVVRHNGPLTYRQQLWAAVLNAGPEAALSGRTAAFEAGLRGWESELIEIVIPRGHQMARLAGVPLYVHESRRFGTGDIHPSRCPPQTTAPRSAIDAAAWTRSPRAACGLVAAAVQQGITTSDQLVEALDLAGKVRHHRLLRSALYDIGGGAQALSEIDLGRICLKYGLPRPERQVVRTDSNGRRRYLDAVLTAPSGRQVIVEVDGAVHLLPATYWDDMRRDNSLVIKGERRLRFPTVACRLEPHTVAVQIARALALPDPPARLSEAGSAIAV